MLWAIIQLLISIFLIIGGLSGQLVLRGTDSSGALVVFGCLWLIVDISNIVKLVKNKDGAADTGNASPLTAAPAIPQKPEKDVFYVFAVQGPAFGTPSGDVIQEKAQKLLDSYEPGKDMELKIVRPSMWNGRLDGSSSAGVITVSYSMDSFKPEIVSYLQREGFSAAIIERGLDIAGKESLMLSNPMSGIFVMGVPITHE